MQYTRAQNAIEFVAMLSVLLLIFIGLFGFIVMQYGSVLIQKDETTLAKALEDIQNEIHQALFAPDGYTRSFYVQDRAIAADYDVSIRNSGEVYINDTRGYQQILFLKPEEYVRGSICTKENEIIKSDDYGIGICCNSCNGTMPDVAYNLSIECKANTSLYWNECSDLSRSDNWTQVRVNCSRWMYAANFTLYNQTGNQVLVTGATSSQTIIRNLSISWVTLTLPTSVRVSNSTYNVSAICFNATSSYVQTGNFTVS